MPIRFYCKQCTGKMKVPDGTGGKTAKCPRCGKLQTIPSETQTRNKTGVVPTGKAAPAASSDSFNAADALAAFTLDDAPLPVAERTAKKADSLDIEQEASIADPALERAIEANSKTDVNLDLLIGGSGGPVPDHPATLEPEGQSRTPEDRGDAPPKRHPANAASTPPLSTPAGPRPQLPPKSETEESEHRGDERSSPDATAASDSAVERGEVPPEFPPQPPVARPKVVGKPVRGALTKKGDAPIVRAKPQLASRAPVAPPVDDDEDDSVYENVSEIADDDSDEPEAGFSTLAEVAAPAPKVVSDSGVHAAAGPPDKDSTLIVLAWVLRAFAALGLGVCVKLVLIVIDLGGSAPINAVVAAVAGLIFVAIPIGIAEGLVALHAIKRRIR